jgi:hypothetical protein
MSCMSLHSHFINIKDDHYYISSFPSVRYPWRCMKCQKWYKSLRRYKSTILWVFKGQKFSAYISIGVSSGLGRGGFCVSDPVTPADSLSPLKYCYSHPSLISSFLNPWYLHCRALCNSRYVLSLKSVHYWSDSVRGEYNSSCCPAVHCSNYACMSAPKLTGLLVLINTAHLLPVD